MYASLIYRFRCVQSTWSKSAVCLAPWARNFTKNPVRFNSSRPQPQRKEIVTSNDYISSDVSTTVHTGKAQESTMVLFLKYWAAERTSYGVLRLHELRWRHCHHTVFGMFRRLSVDPTASNHFHKISLKMCAT